MAKPEWGTKRTCESCGERYYDLNRRPAVCPHCGAKGATESAAPARKATPVEPVKPKDVVVVEVEADKKVAAFEESDADDADDIDAVKDEDNLIEDASDLGEDDDDIAEAMEHVDNGEVTDGN